MKTETYNAHDEKKIYLCIWDDVASPKGVLQIAHGMVEHIARYDDFAKFMNENGFIVAGDDHRAHGNTDPNTRGHIVGSKNVFADTVQDEIGITKMLKERYSLPVVLMGHSYGSFITQAVVAEGAENLSGVVLMGSALQKGMSVFFGNFIGSRRRRKGLSAEPGTTFIKQTFGKYEKQFKEEGPGAWLSRDKERVAKYANDPLCGFACTNGFYLSFFQGLKKIAASKNEKADKNLKMLIVSGSQDPVGGNGKLVTKLYENYKAQGFNPQLKLYEGARHELLNETNRDEVSADILEFVNSCL